MTGPEQLPRYAELPPADPSGRTGWNLFGRDDVGLFNLQTPDRVAAAAALVRRGAVFPLNAAVDVIDPPMFKRAAPRHESLVALNGGALDDVIHDFYPQGSSQWDALGHIAFRPGVFYNGTDADGVVHGGRNTIDHWARRGIAGRAVLLDAEAVLGSRYDDYHPAASWAMTPEHLEECREAAGVTLEAGDVVLLNTGFLRWYQKQELEIRRAIAPRDQLRSAGLAHTEAVAEYLWDHHVCAVAADNPALEVWPPDERPESAPFGYLHRILIAQLGMGIGELWRLADLADDCRQDGRYEMFLTSAPMNLPGAVGSPANALAIK